MKFFIVDDHATVRKGVKQILAEEYLGAEINEASSAEEFLQELNNIKADLVISDINMGGRSGIEMLKQLKVEKPDLPVIILSMHPEEQFAVRCFQAGASGYLTKDAASEELIRAVQKVLNGKKYISASIAEIFAESISGGLGAAMPHEQLSDREMEVLKLFGQGKSISEIADTLFLSSPTVSTYRQRILEKLGLKKTTDIILYAINHHLV